MPETCFVSASGYLHSEIKMFKHFLVSCLNVYGDPGDILVVLLCGLEIWILYEKTANLI